MNDVERKLTIHESHLKAVDLAEANYRELKKLLKDKLKKRQKRCKHLWDKLEPAMFYAMGNTAPGKQCFECGQRRHSTRKEIAAYEEIHGTIHGM